MKKVFDFGKIAYTSNNGRKINRVRVEVLLRESDGKPVFTASGYIWNGRGTDIVCGGQCLDTINEYLGDNEIFKKIYRLWKLHHLNHMHAGTEKQEKITNEVYSHGGDYNEVVKALKEANLYIDNGYTYGTSWLYREIPEDDLKIIKELLELDN